MRLGSGQETRDRIVQSAVKLFAQRGFHATSVQEIVAEAKVTKGAFYHHFGSKDDVLFEIMEFLQLAFAERARRIVEDASGNGEPASTTLAKIIEASVESNERYAAYNLVWVSEIRLLQDDSVDGDRLAALVANARANISLMSSVIRRGVDAGEFRSISDVGAVALAISSLPFYYKLLSPRKNTSTRNASRMWTDFFLHGLGAPSDASTLAGDPRPRPTVG